MARISGSLKWGDNISIISHNQVIAPFNLNFLSLEVVSRYRDTQLQVTEKLCYL